MRALAALNAELLALPSTELPSLTSTETLLALPPPERRLTLKQKRNNNHSQIKTNKVSKINDTFANIEVIGNDIEIIRARPLNTRDRMLRKMKRDQKRPAVDITDLKNKPYINFDAVMDASDKQKREDLIMDLIQQTFPPDNDKFFIEHNPKADTYVIKEDLDQTEKDQIVSSIAAADAKLEKNLTDCESREIKKCRKM